MQKTREKYNEMEVNLKRKSKTRWNWNLVTYHRQLRPMSSKQNLTYYVCLEAGFAENDYVNATKKIQGHNQGLFLKDQDQDLSVKDQDKDKDKDLSSKDQDQDQNFKFVLKDSLRTRTRTTTLVIVDALDILCAQLTRDLFAIAKFL